MGRFGERLTIAPRSTDQAAPQGNFYLMVDKTLSDMAVELSDAEKERLFGSLPLSQQADLANMLWQCETGEQRQTVYGILREWWQAMTVGIN